MSVSEIVGEEIRNFKGSDIYAYMVEAEQYYRNRSSVQGKTNDVEKRSNTKIEHPVLKKLIDQKINYTLSRPFSITSDNKPYSDALNSLFDDAVRQKIKRFGRGAPRQGIGWLIPYISAKGKLSFMVVPATSLIPFWLDDEHTEIEGFIYFRDATVYEGMTAKTVSKAELWDPSGVRYFEANAGGRYREDADKPQASHFAINGAGYNWVVPPIVWCKYNDEELPLQYYLKELLDDINWQTSVTSDVLRDVAKFIWVLENYAGEDLAEFVDALRKNLAIKVETDGGVTTISPDPKVDCVLEFIDKQRRDAIDFGAGVDTKDPELGNASGKAIYFRYMDLDTDSTNLQNELKAAFLRLKPFWDDYFKLIGLGDFSGSTFEVVFNTDMPVDETDIFTNAKAAKEIGMSLRTILSNIPWIKDVDDELERIEKEAADAAKKEDAAIRKMSGLDFPALKQEGDPVGGDTG
jgi:SPP1 family phage portal protein